MIDELPATRRSAALLVSRLQENVCAGVTALEERIAERTAAAPADFLIDAWESRNARHPRKRIDARARGRRRLREGRRQHVGRNRAHLPPSVVAQRPELHGHGFFAAGVSVVLHPNNPHAPTAHCNYRYFEAQAPDGTRSAWWFGGGADLTPYYPAPRRRAALPRHAARRVRGARPAFYPAFKAWCDRYFYLKHRDETRGVGGIFYDYLDASGFGESDERTPSRGRSRSKRCSPS
jgi:coproporphyrinogen III oxidase